MFTGLQSFFNHLTSHLRHTLFATATAGLSLLAVDLTPAQAAGPNCPTDDRGVQTQGYEVENWNTYGNVRRAPRGSGRPQNDWSAPRGRSSDFDSYSDERNADDLFTPNGSLYGNGPYEGRHSTYRRTTPRYHDDLPVRPQNPPRGSWSRHREEQDDSRFQDENWSDWNDNGADGWNGRSNDRGPTRPFDPSYDRAPRRAPVRPDQDFDRSFPAQPRDRYQDDRDNRDFAPPFVQPVPRAVPQAPTYQAGATTDEIQARISRRYQTSGFDSLLALPAQSNLALYEEVLQMIDQRHLEPAPIEARVKQGYINLSQALVNPQFQQANRLRLTADQAARFKESLKQLAAQAPLSTNRHAVTLVSQTAQLAQQQIGLRPSATILEFVYGAAESLDKYSTFVPPERNAGASLQLEESIVGIGVQVETADSGVKVVKVIQNGPAAEAGLQAGDTIVAIAGQDVVGMQLDQTVGLITGPEGSQVEVTVQRERQGAFTVAIPRRTVELHTVTEVQMLGQVGYFKLEKFGPSSSSEMDAALNQLHQQGMQALIVDLRGNPGGLLTAAIEISDKFLPEGVIVSTRGRTAQDNSQEVATKPQTWKIPLTVIVDHNSASASEIFAAAIQENGRGTIVGRTSYGKGTVQTQFPLHTAGASLRITTAKFYSPKGREMAGSGVTPDFAVPESGATTVGSLATDRDVRAAYEIATGRNPQNMNTNVSRTPVQGRPNGV